MRYGYIVRSANALTIDRPVVIDGEEVFIKVATANTQVSTDSISIDAINSVIMNVIDPAHEWTIDFKDIQYATVFRDDYTFEMSRTNPKPLYRDQPDVETGFRALVYKNIVAKDAHDAFENNLRPWSQWSRMITTLLQHIIDANVTTGFMHNDLHLQNVVYDTNTDTLRTLDYGRVVFDKPFMPKYTHLESVKQAVAPIAHMVDTPNIRKAWKWNNFRNATQADHITEASEMRWCTDIMKVCILYYSELTKSGKSVPFLTYDDRSGNFQAVSKTIKSPEAFTKAIRNTPVVFNPILAGLVMYAVVDWFLQGQNYMGEGIEECWWHGGLIAANYTEPSLLAAIKSFQHPKFKGLMQEVTKRSNLNMYIDNLTFGGAIESSSESEDEYEDMPTYEEDFLFDHRGVHPTSLAEAMDMPSMSYMPTDDADVEQVHTPEPEPWKFDHTIQSAIPQSVYGGRAASPIAWVPLTLVSMAMAVFGAYKC